MSSDQASLLLDTLKVFLKQHGITYKELAQRCRLSEVSIKRLLNRPHIGLDQLLQLCQAAGTDLPHLLQLSAEHAASQSQPMAAEQVDVMFKKPALLTIFKAILAGLRSVSEIAKEFSINQPSAYLYVRELEQLNYVGLDGDTIKVRFPLQTSIMPETNLDVTSMMLQRIFLGIQQFILERGSKPADDFKGGITAGNLILDDQEYEEYTEELEKLVEIYQRKSLANIQLPNRKNKMREQLIMAMPFPITEPFPVTNLVEDTHK